ncbi:glycosyltransferase [Aurantimicrobium minutum]|uniref:glycosyltransferase n=1 Tax=Aurantimicrobium minutum TaxID=708131 RepID=UPI00247606AD|nr:glycosyltransferase [Aurantimicrobium minutum]MDH6256028.1 glycosyltransferase involved in cell wall biosynthesis [Aurantimicrobium minutum]
MKHAFVLSYTDLVSDPRVQKQINWLIEDGWAVDTLGYGKKPHKLVNKHFQISPKKRNFKHKIRTLLSHLFLGNQNTYNYSVSSYLPSKDFHKRLTQNPYDFILVNDIDLLPWIQSNALEILKANKNTLFHLDVHEFHEWTEVQGIPKIIAKRLNSYHSWISGLIGLDLFNTRSTVAEIIAEFYANEFHIPKPIVIRNSKQYEKLVPTSVDPNKIELVYHGNSDLTRGLGTFIESLPLLEKRFHINFMLTGTPEAIAKVKSLASNQGDRVTFHDAVPMIDVPASLNKFDLGLIYFPPVTENFRLSLPNKFFESIQARLGVVVGDAPSMQPYIDEYQIGVNVPGWGPEFLATTLNSLDTAQIEKLKSNTNRCAEEVNSEADRKAMLSIANS